MSQLVIATTLHDPKNRLLDFFIKTLKNSGLPANPIYLVITKDTGSEYIEALQKTQQSLHMQQTEFSGIVGNYRLALQWAVDQTINNDQILYIDFDRLLHWINNYPTEWIRIIHTYSADYIHIARSQRAFESHPNTQKKTEQLVNYISGKAINTNKNLDIISVSWIASRKLTKMVINFPTSTKYGFYALWPVIMWTNAKKVIYKEVEGQEWETPDRYQKEIRKIGKSKWIKEFQTKIEWEKRVDLMNDCILELISHFL